MWPRTVAKMHCTMQAPVFHCTIFYVMWCLFHSVFVSTCLFPLLVFVVHIKCLKKTNNSCMTNMFKIVYEWAVDLQSWVYTSSSDSLASLTAPQENLFSLVQSTSSFYLRSSSKGGLYGFEERQNAFYQAKQRIASCQ